MQLLGPAARDCRWAYVTLEWQMWVVSIGPAVMTVSIAALREIIEPAG